MDSKTEFKDMVGLLLWLEPCHGRDLSSLGRTSKGEEEGMSPSMSMSSCSACRSAWGWMRNLERVYW